MKRQTMLTDHQAETWLAVLSQFPVKVVNRAVLVVALSSDPFPDLHKVVLQCQFIAWQTSDQYAPGRDTNTVSTPTLEKIAAALRLEV